MNQASTALAGLSLGVAQFKSQSLSSMLFADTSSDLFSGVSQSSDPFSSWLTSAQQTLLSIPTPTTPSGLDASQPFSRPGQNVMTVLNRVDVSFKAQFSELSALKTSLTQEQAAADALSAIDVNTTNDNIKSAIRKLIDNYNDGVMQFNPDMAQGGILQGSQEAARARFATARDINNPLTGADGGVRGGMNALGMSIDPATGLVSLDEAKLDAMLVQDKPADTRTIVDFAHTLSATISNLNATGHPQDKQLDNLHRAIDWIAANRDSVQQEFGAGQAATPNAAFKKAAAAYDLMQK